MRYITVAESLSVAAAILGVDPRALATEHTLNLLDSALHAPQASFDGVDLVPGLEAKAATLAFHISRNHPLPDGNKRLAWVLMNAFLDVNGYVLDRDEARAICLMWSVAAGEAGVDGIRAVITHWLRLKEPVLV